MVGLITLIEIPPRHSAKVLGWFFYVALLTKRKYESKQCQKKYAKCQHILEIKMISHRHHPHSIQNRGQPTLQHGCSYSHLNIATHSSQRFQRQFSTHIFSAAIRHSAGRSAASFLILDIYRPCEKDTVARLLSFVNSMQFSMFPDISAIEISFTSTPTLSAIRSAASSDAKPFSRILRKDFSESPVPPAGGVPFPPP